MAEFQALVKIQRIEEGSWYHVWIPNSAIDERRQGKSFRDVTMALGQGIRWVHVEDDGDPAFLDDARSRVKALRALLVESEKALEAAEGVAKETGINLTAEDWAEIDEKSLIIVDLLSGKEGATTPWIDKYGVPVVMGLAKLRDKDKDGDKDIDVTMSWSPYAIPRP